VRPRLPAELREIAADPFGAVRAGCAYVAAHAESVRIDAARLEAFARTIPADALAPLAEDPFPELPPDVETRCAFVLLLDSVNFGSGYWPWLRKRPGCSGYRTVEASLLDHFRENGAPRAQDLAGIDAPSCAALFGQTLEPPIDELMALFARAWRELGACVHETYAGRFSALVEAASGEAAALARTLLGLPLFRDVSPYRGRRIPLLKRAQIVAVDLAAALPPPLGSFRDLEQLTLFADNLVPHVLRLDGVLGFSPELVERIDAEQPIEAHSPEEVEIRACAVHAVEALCAALRQRGLPAHPYALDRWLWLRGGQPSYKAHPRHRTRSPYY